MHKVFHPTHIEITGAHVHNLKDLSLKVPLNCLVGISGVSGSGKSSLALGVLYAEGSRRYLEGLSAYTRRRLTQAMEAKVESIEHVPAALALHQRPTVPSIRSTFGTLTELLNVLRLMFSRLGSHCCPNGHHLTPTAAAARDQKLVCPKCGAVFTALSAEDFSFNSNGACRRCSGTGRILEVDESTLIADENLTLEEGAVAPWNSLMWSLMVDVCREMGVRTNVSYKDLSPKEQEIVLHGPAVKKHILYKAKNSNQAAELDFTYYSAVYTVENALSKVRDDKGMKRVEKFLKEGPCPECHGTRLNAQARSVLLDGKTLPQLCALSLSDLLAFLEGLEERVPPELHDLALALVRQLKLTASRLLELGLGYLSLDRPGNTLSTGELQRVQLARAVRSRTTGTLFVLDEPSIGLHPKNTAGLLHLIDDLLAQGNSVVLVDHDARVLKACDYLIELGPEAGRGGGNLVAQGTPQELACDPRSLTGPFLKDHYALRVRPVMPIEELFTLGEIALETRAVHTVKPLKLKIPRGRLTAITGVSGSGKTTLILECLVPALKAQIAGSALPDTVAALKAPWVNRVSLVDAAPIGANVRSTVATYSQILDELRRIYARTEKARELKLKAGDFSYNTGSLRCPNCDGTGEIVEDVQFLPDIELPCPKCQGTRYADKAFNIKWTNAAGKALSLPELLKLTVKEALEYTNELKKVRERLKVLEELGLGYLSLNESTTLLSGGEAQRLKLADDLGRELSGGVFVFDEPTIGLHPLDVKKLLEVMQRLIESGATVIVIEHDVDFISNADYVVDLGPGGGAEGGRIVACGTPSELKENPESITGSYLP